MSVSEAKAAKGKKHVTTLQKKKTTSLLHGGFVCFDRHTTGTESHPRPTIHVVNSVVSMLALPTKRQQVPSNEPEVPVSAPEQTVTTSEIAKYSMICSKDESSANV